MNKLTTTAIALLALMGTASLQAQTSPPAGDAGSGAPAATDPASTDVAPEGGRGVTPDSGTVTTVPQGGRGETAGSSNSATDGGTAGGATKMDPKKKSKEKPAPEESGSVPKY